MLIRKTVVQGLLLSARRYNSFISAVHGDFFTPDLLLGEDINQYGLATYTSVYLQEPNKLTQQITLCTA